MIKELEAIRGRHTELVSVYVPAGGNLVDTINQLENEKATASNIKSKSTRKNVMSALEKIIQHLRTFRQTPPNGLIVFAGNVSSVEGREDIKLWSFEPPEKMSTKIYWCDQVFVLEPLKELTKEKEIYGLVVLDANEATIGLLSGKRITTLKKLEGNVPGKSVKGGMSQMRYDRLREDALNEFLTKIGEVASKSFLEQENLKGILVGGPGPVKERIAKEDYLHYKLKQKILGVKDIGYTDEHGLEELVRRSQDLLQAAAIAHERELMEKFFTKLNKGEAVAYGYTETKKALELGAVETLLISEAFDWIHVDFACSNNHNFQMDLPKTEVGKQKCEICGNKLNAVEVRELAEDLAEAAAQKGAKIEIISTDTQEGRQFKQIGGVGAFLRYKLE